jgi:hypothetical protein
MANVDHHPGRTLWLNWTAAMGVGELIGFGPLAIVLPTLQGAGTTESTIAILAIFGGVIEGTAVGTAQSLVLRRYLPHLPARAWIVATALAAVFAYALVLIPMQFLALDTLPAPLLIGGGAVFGILFVISIGGAQWLVLRNHVARSGAWIAANAIAWPLGAMLPVVTITAVPDGSPVPAFILAGILGGLLMGLLVGALTGAVLVRLIGSRTSVTSLAA